jgi:hypothetical protein
MIRLGKETATYTFSPARRSRGSPRGFSAPPSALRQWPTSHRALGKLGRAATEPPSATVDLVP